MTEQKDSCDCWKKIDELEAELKIAREALLRIISEDWKHTEIAKEALSRLSEGKGD